MPASNLPISSVPERVLLLPLDNAVTSLMRSNNHESRSERIPRSLLWGKRAIRINSTTLRIEDSLQLAAGSFNSCEARGPAARRAPLGLLHPLFYEGSDRRLRTLVDL